MDLTTWYYLTERRRFGTVQYCLLENDSTPRGCFEGSVTCVRRTNALPLQQPAVVNRLVLKFSIIIQRISEFYSGNVHFGKFQCALWANERSFCDASG